MFRLGIYLLGIVIIFILAVKILIRVKILNRHSSLLRWSTALAIINLLYSLTTYYFIVYLPNYCHEFLADCEIGWSFFNIHMFPIEILLDKMDMSLYRISPILSISLDSLLTGAVIGFLIKTCIFLRRKIIGG